jgi:hypothetical protein
VLQNETPNLPDFLQNSLISDPGAEDLFSQFADVGSLDDASSSFDLLSDLASSFAPGLADQINVLGQTMVSIGDGVSDAADAGELLGAGACFGPIGIAVAGIAAVFSLFDNNGPSPTEQELLQQNNELLQGETQILQGEGTILTNLNLMQSNMDVRFNQIDQALNTVYGSMESNFYCVNSNLNQILYHELLLSNQIAGVSNEVESGFSSMSSSLAQINGLLFQQQSQLNAFEQSVFQVFAYEDWADYAKNVNTYIGYQANHNGVPMGSNYFTQNAQPLLYEVAMIDSTDPAINRSCSSCDLQDLSSLISTNDASSSFYGIATFLQATLPIPPIVALPANLLTPTGAGPNPVFWAYSANAYLELLRENPALARTVSQNYVGNIMEYGQAVRTDIENITYSPATGVNWTLWQQLFAYYNGLVAALNTQMLASEGTLKNNGAGTDLIHQKYYVHFLAGGATTYPVNSTNISGDGIGAEFSYFGALYPASTGGVRGMGQNSDGSYSICSIDPQGQVTVEITIPPSPLIDNVPLMQPEGCHGYTMPLQISSFLVTPNGTPHVTVFNTAFDANCNPVKDYSRCIYKVDPGGQLETWLGNADPSAGCNPATGCDPDGPLQSAFAYGPNLVNESADGSQIYFYDMGLDSLRVVSQGQVSTLLQEITESANGLGVLYWPDYYYYYQPYYYYPSFPGFPYFAQSVEPFVPGPANVSYGSVVDYYTVMLSNSPPTIASIIDLSAATGIGTVEPGISLIGSNITFNSSTDDTLKMSIAGNPDGTLWVQQSTAQGSKLSIYDPATQTTTLVYSNVNDLFSGADGLASSAFLGRILPSMCVSAGNELYLLVMGSDGEQLVRIGPAWELQQDAFQLWQTDFGGGPSVSNALLTSAMQDLQTVKTVITDLVSLGLSQSVATDDLLHSLLYGPNGLLDMQTAENYVKEEAAILSSGPAYPILDLPTLASNRIAIVQARVTAHLLDVQSRASTPATSLALDLSYASGHAIDNSPLTNVVGSTGAFEITNQGLSEPSSYVLQPNWGAWLSVTNPAFDFGTNSDFTIAFWVWLPQETEVFLGGSPNTTSDEGWSIDCAFTNEYLDGWTMNASFGPGVTPVEANAANFVDRDFFRTKFWFHVAVVFTRAGGDAYAYVDGSQITNFSLPQNAPAIGSGKIFIGGGSNPATAYTQAPLVNEVSVWTRALGPTEIQEIYNSALQGTSVPTLAQSITPSANPNEMLNMIENTMQNLQFQYQTYNVPLPRPQLVAAPVATAGQLQLQVFGAPGANYMLEASSDLRSWEAVQNNILEGSLLTVPIGSGSQAVFFRAANQPPPE